jgi:cysteinyl-tRNA synthetase
MSKSKGNFYLLKDILEKGYTANEMRLLLLSSHYRSQMNFTWEAMEQAKNNLQKIFDWVSNLKSVSGDSKGSTFGAPKVEPLENLEKIDFSHIYQKRFESAMNDDINTPLALAVLYDLISETNKMISEEKLDKETAENILKFWERINKVFGLIITENKIEIPADILKLAEERKQARISGNFAASDELRKKIELAGYVIEDLKDNNYLLKIK